MPEIITDSKNENEFPNFDYEVEYPDFGNLMDYAQNFKNSIAPGFKLIDSGAGVEIYQNGPDYVISCELSKGASVNIAHGSMIDRGSSSVYGGPNPDFARANSEEALNLERQKNPETVAVANAGFFANYPRNTAPLAFPFKHDGLIETEGFAAKGKHQGNRLTLVFTDSYASLSVFDNNDISEFRKLKEANAVVSLSPRVNIDGRAEAKIGRTFLGLGNPVPVPAPVPEGRKQDTENGVPLSAPAYSRILLFVSKASSQAHAELTLRQFGAGPTMMLDGGGSSQLRWKERDLVDTTRSVPQFISIRAARKEDQTQNLETEAQTQNLEKEPTDITRAQNSDHCLP